MRDIDTLDDIVYFGATGAYLLLFDKRGEGRYKGVRERVRHCMWGSMELFFSGGFFFFFFHHTKPGGCWEEWVPTLLPFFIEGYYSSIVHALSCYSTSQYVKRVGCVFRVTCLCKKNCL